LSYIGREPQIGNFQMCDAISVVNNQASYTMQVGGVAVIPGGNFNVICSLNGVIQKSGTSFVTSSSTITFSQNLVTGDVIDFILILGSVLDLGVPSDGTVTTSKIVNSNVTNAKLQNSSITLNGSAVSLGGSATIGGGKIGQVVTATTTTEVTNTSTTYADVGLSASITPTATSSKIYVIVSLSSMGYSGSSANNISGFARLLRGSTEIGVYLNCRTDNVTAFQNGATISANNLDSPSTASSVTYKVQQKIVTAGNGRSISIGFGSTLSTITLMEVLA